MTSSEEPTGKHAIQVLYETHNSQANTTVSFEQCMKNDANLKRRKINVEGNAQVTKTSSEETRKIELPDLHERISALEKLIQQQTKAIQFLLFVMCLFLFLLVVKCIR